METSRTEASDVGTVVQQQQPQQEGKHTRVMVAIDESDGSLYALKWVLDKLFMYAGEAQEGSEVPGLVTLVHAQVPFQPVGYPAVPAAAAFYTTPAMVENVRKAQTENSAALLARAEQICRDKKIKAAAVILNGDPAEMICQAAEEMHVDLLAMGTRGLGNIKRAFLGSVSDDCAHNAKCPVLIVKPPKEQSKQRLRAAA